MRLCAVIAVSLVVTVARSAEANTLAPDAALLVENAYVADGDLRDRPWRAAVRSTHPPGQVGYAPLGLELRRLEAKPGARIATPAQRLAIAAPRVRVVGVALLAVATALLALLCARLHRSWLAAIAAALLPLSPGAAELARLSLLHEELLAMTLSLAAAVAAHDAISASSRRRIASLAATFALTAMAALASECGVILAVGLVVGVALATPHAKTDLRAPLLACAAAALLYLVIRTTIIASPPTAIATGPEAAPLFSRLLSGARCAFARSTSIVPGVAPISGTHVVAALVGGGLIVVLAALREVALIMMAIAGLVYALLCIGSEPSFASRAPFFIAPALALFGARGISQLAVAPVRAVLFAVIAVVFAAIALPRWSWLSSTEALAASGSDRDGRLLRAIDATYLGRTDVAFEHLAAIVSSTTEVRDIEHYYLLVTALSRGSMSLAQNAGMFLERDAAQSPYRAVAALRHGDAYESSSFRLARTAYLDAVHRNPDLLAATTALAGLLHATSEHALALADLTEIVALYRGRTTPITVSLEYATAQVRAGQVDAGLSTLRALAIEHPRTDVRVRLGAMLIETGALDEGQSVLEGALAIDGSDIQVLQNLAAAHLRRRRVDEAESMLLRALAAAPEDSAAHVPTHHNLAVVERLRKNPARALDRIERALSIDPRHRPSVMLKGDALMDLGRFEDAFQTYAYLLSLRADDIPARLRLAWANYARGDREHARAEALEVKKRTTDEAFVREADRLLQATAAKGTPSGS
jgi:Flp pilus assembly protein TadD